jgi:hypothetical protein
MGKVAYEVVILDTVTQKVTDDFSPVVTSLDTAKDWLRRFIDGRTLHEGFEYRIRKTTVELV